MNFEDDGFEMYYYYYYLHVFLLVFDVYLHYYELMIYFFYVFDFYQKRREINKEKQILFLPIIEIFDK